MKNRDTNPFTGDLFANTIWTPNGWVFDPAKATEQWRDSVDKDTFEKTGVVRWSSNGSVPHSDMLGDFLHLGYITEAQYKGSVEARRKDDDKFFEEYRKQQANRVLSAEERFEMEAAFGPGATVVDVITGQEFKL